MVKEISIKDISQTADNLFLMVKKLNETNSKLTFKAGCEMLILQELLNNPRKKNIGRIDLFPDTNSSRFIDFDFNQGNVRLDQINQNYTGLLPTKLERIWLSETKSNSKEWETVLADLMKFLLTADKLSHNDLYYITHVVFFLSDFGLRELKLNQELKVCKHLLLDFVNGASENLDLKLEAILALIFLGFEPIKSKDLTMANKFYKKNGFIKPSLNNNDASSLYGIFHASSVFLILSIVRTRTPNNANFENN